MSTPFEDLTMTHNQSYISLLQTIERCGGPEGLLKSLNPTTDKIAPDASGPTVAPPRAGIMNPIIFLRMNIKILADLPWKNFYLVIISDERDTLEACGVGYLPGVVGTTLHNATCTYNDVGLVSEYAWMLVNVAVGTSDQTSAIVAGGGIPKLIAIFRTAPDRAKLSALMALGNIASESGRLREIVIREGGLEPALEVLGDPERYPPKFFDTAAWMIERATSQEDVMCIILDTRKPVLPILLKFIQLRSHDNTEAMSYVVKALTIIASNSEAIITIINSQMTSRLVQLCVTENRGLQEDAIRILSRFE
ncbi:hypothetical protein FRC04_004965 [Tulasnella sp. 424]|nr:hypothetical protein FRC04_004965 [Tulasnella sp. 424]